MHPDTRKVIQESLREGMDELKDFFEDLDGQNKHTFAALQLRQENVESMHKIAQDDLFALVNDLKVKHEMQRHEHVNFKTVIERQWQDSNN
jgi:type III secretory pathway component EscR